MSAHPPRGAVLAAVLVPLVLAVLPAPARGQCASSTPKPAVIWNTYLGGGTLPEGGVSPTNKTDELEGVKTNDLGEVFVTGRTNSVAFPSTTGLPATGAVGSGFDAFVAKFGADGTRQWVRVFGGYENDSGRRVALAKSGDVYVVGTTQSSALLDASGAGRTVLTHQGAANGKDAFLAKLTPTGELSWFMFLGGGEEDEGLGLDVSPDGNAVYVVGRSNSSLSGLGTRYGLRGDGFDGFIIKVDVTDASVPKHVWTRLLGSEDTFFGFDADDAAYSVVARADAVFVGGVVGSIMLDVPGAVIRQLFHRGDDDGFVAKLNPSDASFIWFTNVGYGNGETAIRDLLVRSDGELVTVGTTTSPDFITPSSNSGSDVFVFRLDAEGMDVVERNGVVAKRRLSGGGEDVVEGHAALDSKDNLFIGGRTGSGAFVTNGFDTAFEGSTDGFVMMLDGVDLTTRWSSYVGGNSPTPEEVRGVAVDSQGRITLSGYSSAEPKDFFMRDVGDDRSQNGGVDGFVFRVVLDSTAPLTGTVTAGSTPRGRITASWEGFSDPESSIDRYEWAIRGSDGFNVQGFEPVNGTTATAEGFLPVVGRPYFVTVRATNGAGCTSEEARSEEVVLTSQPAPLDEGNEPEVLSPLGWSCGSTGGGGAVGSLALTTLVLWGGRRVRPSLERQRARGSVR